MDTTDRENAPRAGAEAVASPSPVLPLGVSAVSMASLIQEITSLVEATDRTDLPGLVELQEKLQALAALDALDHGAKVGVLSARAIEAVDAIILREAADEVAAFESLRAAIDAIVVSMAPPESPNAAGAETVAALADHLDLELLEAWLSATADNLATLESTAVNLETEPADDPDLVAEARRIVHTIKGEAGFLSLESVRRMCHAFESHIDRCLDAGRRFPGNETLALVDWLKRCLDALSRDALACLPDASALFAQIRSAAAHVEREAAGTPRRRADDAFDDAAPVTFPDDLSRDENLAEFISEAREHLTAAEQAILVLERDPSASEPLGTVFRAFHTVKGVAGFMNLVPIVELAHETETLLDHARTGRLVLNPACLDAVLRACDVMDALVGALEGRPAPARGTLNRLLHALRDPLEADPLEVCTDDAASRAAPATRPPDAAPPTTDLSVPDVGLDETHDKAPSAESPRPAPPVRRARREATVKVSTGRLDTLVTMVGELVIAQQMILQDPAIQSFDGPRVQRSLAQVSKIVRDLQGVSMALSMVPVRTTFQKMARLVRDTAAKSGKAITFSMKGEDTELDRNVVEAIGDPIVHMIRNACDHGIETVDERRAAGKSESGVLVLSAYHQGGSIIIEIRDDGRGLDRDRIRAKAIARRLVPADLDPDELSDSDIDNLIFHPGFSTADSVTDLSGRGVGMDVVRKNIEALRGEIEIHSRPGEGSTFRMRLPLTMAIIDGMVVGVGGDRFVLPTLAIEHSFRPTPHDLESTLGAGELVRVRGDLLPIHRLGRIFDLTPQSDDLTDGLLVLIESSDGRFCLAVDEIIGQHQVVIKSLGEGLPSIRGVAGGAILGDGRVALILDVLGLSQAATSPPGPGCGPGSDRTGPPGSFTPPIFTGSEA